MKKQELLDKWIPRFKYTTILSNEVNEFIKDIETNGFSCDEILQEINRICEV